MVSSSICECSSPRHMTSWLCYVKQSSLWILTSAHNILTILSSSICVLSSPLQMRSWLCWAVQLVNGAHPEHNSLITSSSLVCEWNSFITQHPDYNKQFRLWASSCKCKRPDYTKLTLAHNILPMLLWSSLWASSPKRIPPRRDLCPVQSRGRSDAVLALWALWRSEPHSFCWPVLPVQAARDAVGTKTGDCHQYVLPPQHSTSSGHALLAEW